ncbi:hypothetical protein Goshw_003207 [Gossypium schwendimanii]|uniref:Uncharacterized protein n=1 Tax=Gossypium schwendimanii TaxID=34291 RepID=A0A7J9N128_GOSSC|nr:hypothetical protein [Gossypium schwendimanii]
MEIWEDRYEYQPTREPIIIPELACVPKYMPWFRIHGKPYLLTLEERQRQIRMMPGAFLSPFMYPNPYMYPFLSPMVGWSQWPDSAPFFVTPSRPLMYRQAA